MSYRFSEKDIEKISGIFGTEPDKTDEAWSWRLSNKNTGQSLVFNIHNDVDLGGGRSGGLLSAQTHHGYYELHECHGFVVFEPDEVIFVHYREGLVSSMIIGRQCTCSTYSNISRDILNADFAKLDPAVLLSAMQLSLTESILPE